MKEFTPKGARKQVGIQKEVTFLVVVSGDAGEMFPSANDIEVYLDDISDELDVRVKRI